MGERRVYNVIYWLTIPFIAINTIIFVWQLSRLIVIEGNQIYSLTNDRMARICFSFMLISSFILLVTLLIQFIYFIRNRTRNWNITPKDRLFVGIKHSISLKKQKDVLEVSKPRTDTLSQRFYDRFGSYEKALQLSSQVFPVTIDEEVKEISLDSLIYDEEILDARCGICKLTFITNQVVVFCPNCEISFTKNILVIG